MLTKTEIAKRIKSVKTRSSNLRTDIQTILLNVAGHVFDHGDNSQFADLLSATVGMNGRAIGAWIEDYGLCTVKGKGQSVKVRTARKVRADLIASEQFENGDAYVEYLTENAREWWSDVEAEKAAKVIEPAKTITNLAARIAKGDNATVFSVTEMREALALLTEALNECEGAEDLVEGFAIKVEGHDMVELEAAA